jgi:hypothetical protein
LDGLSGRGRGGDFDPRHNAHASTAALVQRCDDPQMVSVEWRAIHPLGQNDLFRLEFGCDLSERQYRAIAVSTENLMVSLDRTAFD